MCTYIAATLPIAADAVRIRSIAGDHGLGWQEFANRHLLQQIGSGSKWFLTSRKHCDCATALGSADPTRLKRTHDPKADVPALRKQGWSEAKVARWLADKADVDKRRQAKHARGAGRTPEVNSWLSFLGSALASGATTEVGVLIHDYTRRIEGEKVSIKRREAVAAAGITPERLLSMESDVLYEFKH